MSYTPPSGSSGARPRLRDVSMTNSGMTELEIEKRKSPILEAMTTRVRELDPIIETLVRGNESRKVKTPDRKK